MRATATGFISMRVLKVGSFFSTTVSIIPFSSRRVMCAFRATCSAACAALAAIWLTATCGWRTSITPTPPLIATAPVIMFIIVLSFPPDFWEGRILKALALKNMHGRFAASS